MKSIGRIFLDQTTGKYEVVLDRKLQDVLDMSKVYVEEANDKADQSGADEREKFEAWASSNYSDRYEYVEFDLREDGQYRHGLLRDLWKAWKAALASTQAIAQTAPAVVGEAEINNAAADYIRFYFSEDMNDLRQVAARAFCAGAEFAAPSQGAKQ